MSIKNKLVHILQMTPECYWTFHSHKVVKNFFYLYFKKGFFQDPKIYDYYFIFFLLSHGDICFSDIPVNLRIKRKKYNRVDVTYENHKKNDNFYLSLNFLSKNFLKRGLNKKIAKNLLIKSFDMRMRKHKPRHILLKYNFFEKINHLFMKIIKKIIQKLYFKDSIFSQNDIYYVTKLEKSKYDKINNKKFNLEFKDLFKKMINPNN